MGDIVKLDRLPARPQPAPEVPVLLAPGAALIAASVAAACWWTTAWLATLRLGYIKPAAEPESAPAVPAPRLRLHANSPRVSPEALAPDRCSSSS